MYSIVVRQLYNLQSDPLIILVSIHLISYIVITVLLTIFSMLYLTSPWLLCTYQFVLRNSFTFFTQPGNPSFVLYSCEVIWYLFFSVWLISLSIIPSRLLIKLPVYFISLNLSHLTYDLITLNHSIFLKHTECQIPFCLCSCSLHSLEMFLSLFSPMKYFTLFQG